STEITIKRKSVEPVKRIKITVEAPIIRTPKQVHTPVRRLEFLTPSAMVKIKGSPRCKRYKSARKIDF
ncbi:hypothetical protein COBT_003343, partial [Conglomerata obtusa]